MEDQVKAKIGPQFRTTGREVMRIDGVYMYIINEAGNVGAIMGFHPMVIVMYEDVADNETIQGYLRVGRWLYPLARTYSPIFIWGTDRLIMPEPFSTFTKPVYIVIRIPFATSRFQKDTLFNLLDVSAHVKGQFANLTPVQILAQDKLFALTSLTKAESIELDKAGELVCCKLARDIPVWNRPDQVHKLLSFPRQVKLDVDLSPVKRNAVTVPIGPIQSDRSSISESTITPIHEKTSWSVVVEAGSKLVTGSTELPTGPGGIPELVELPRLRGNTIRIYLLGPRDPQHIKISTVMEWVPVKQIILSAISNVFREQVRLRMEKEQAGFPPTLEGRKARWMQGWACAKEMNQFNVAGAKHFTDYRACKPIRPNDPGLRIITLQATQRQDLEAAAILFDSHLDLLKLELLNFAFNFEKDVSADHWLEPLVNANLMVQYRRLLTEFTQLRIIGHTIESDLVYPKLTNYLERVHEDCEHHYPKLRPRNVLLDPKYDYPRKPPSYYLPV